MLFLVQIVVNYKLFFLNFYSSIKNIIFFTFDGQKWFSNTPEFLNQSFVQKGKKTKERYAAFLEQAGLREDTYLVEYPHPMCFSVGYNLRFSEDSHAAIFMSQGLLELDENAFSFLLKHETSHIRCSDVFMRSLVAGFAAGLYVGLWAQVFPLWRALLMGFLIIPASNHFVGSLWMRWREYQADSFAIKHSNLEELQGAVRYFTAVKTLNASLSDTCPQYTSEGELTHGLHYPSMASRIKRFQKALEKKGGAPYSPSDEEIDAHVELLKTNDEALKTMLSQPLVSA